MKICSIIILAVTLTAPTTYTMHNDADNAPCSPAGLYLTAAGLIITTIGFGLNHLYKNDDRMYVRAKNIASVGGFITAMGTRKILKSSCNN